jgi:hypothetical protein
LLREANEYIIRNSLYLDNTLQPEVIRYIEALHTLRTVIYNNTESDENVHTVFENTWFEMPAQVAEDIELAWTNVTNIRLRLLQQVREKIGLK